MRTLSAETYDRIKTIEASSEKAALKVAGLTLEHAVGLKNADGGLHLLTPFTAGFCSASGLIRGSRGS